MIKNEEINKPNKFKKLRSRRARTIFLSAAVSTPAIATAVGVLVAVKPWEKSDGNRNATTLNKGLFQASGEAYSGTISLKPEASIPKNFKVQYSKDKDQGFADSISADLKNGDKVYAKLVSIDINGKTTPTPTDDAVEITVSGLTLKTITTNQVAVVPANFIATGTAGAGSLAPNSGITPPTDMEFQYSKDKTTGFGTTSPADLKNGDKIYVKVVSTDTNNVATPTDDAIEITVSGLTPITLTSSPTSPATNTDLTNVIEILGDKGTGYLSLKSGTTIPNGLKVQYSTDDKKWLDASPTTLDNGGKVYVKLTSTDPNNIAEPTDSHVEVSINGLYISRGDFDKLYSGALSPDGKKFALEAFKGKPLPEGFTIPNSVTTIDGAAFSGATLPAGFTIPNSVTEIGKNAFWDATLPAGFTIPNSVTTIGSGAFYLATLPAGFTIPNSVTTISFKAFERATLPAGFTIPNSVTTINYAAFSGVTLPAGFTIPNSVTTIDDGAFMNATLPSDCHWEVDGKVQTEFPSLNVGHEYKVVHN